MCKISEQNFISTMAGPTSKKRNHQDFGSKAKSQRPTKKQKKQFQYHSDSDEEEPSNPNFKPVNLLDSDNEELDNIAVDDVPSASGSGSESSGSEIDQKAVKAALRNKKRKAQQPAKDAPPSASNSEAEPEVGNGSNNDGSSSSSEGEEEEEDGDEYSDDDDDQVTRKNGNSKSKRNDPSAFATSISKILSTKLSTTRRVDPVLARSADAQNAAREVVDSALEAKARKQMREQRRLAQEKGRVRDVLGGGVNDATTAPDQLGDGSGVVVYTQQSERRLRKVAHRGVVVLFRAVREAQERAAQAERDARKEGVYGVKTREEKVSEMSRQGFLDLIANGGGKMKKGGLEEA